nr:hypothetical protein [Mycobacterium tilburgii]
MLPLDAVPAGLWRDLTHFGWDPPVVKINYALDSPIPWHAKVLRDVGTVHLGAYGPGLIRWMADVNTRTVPAQPFMLLGSDHHRGLDPIACRHRKCVGLHAFTARRARRRFGRAAGGIDGSRHRTTCTGLRLARCRTVPATPLRSAGARRQSAPRHAQRRDRATAAAADLSPGDRYGPRRNTVERLYLASASATPGGSVHGACGRNAAKAALAADGVTGWPRRNLRRTVFSLLIGNR